MFEPNDKVVRKDDQSKVLIVVRVWGDAVTCIDIYNERKPIYLDAEQLLAWPIVTNDASITWGAT